MKTQEDRVEVLAFVLDLSNILIPIKTLLECERKQISPTLPPSMLLSDLPCFVKKGHQFGLIYPHPFVPVAFRISFKTYVKLFIFKEVAS